jgi:hypothetical protein
MRKRKRREKIGRGEVEEIRRKKRYSAIRRDQGVGHGQSAMGKGRKVGR